MWLPPTHRWYMRATLLVLATAIAACGSGDSAGDNGQVEISGVSSKDRQIAADLRQYIAPCPGGAYEIALNQAWRSGSKAERRLIREYGSVEAGLEAMQRTCASFQRIEVNDWVITVKTTLRSTDTQNAADICNTIQGADVADFVPGHTVLGEDDEVLARCRPLTDYSGLRNPVQRRCERNPARCRA